MSNQVKLILDYITLTNDVDVQSKNNDDVLHKKQVLDLISENNFRIVGDNFIHDSLSDLSDFFETTNDSVRLRMEQMITQVGNNLTRVTGDLKTSIDESQEEIRDLSEALYEYIINENSKDKSNLDNLSDEVFQYYVDKKEEIENLSTSIDDNIEEIQYYRAKGSNEMYLVESSISNDLYILSDTIEEEFENLISDCDTLKNNFLEHTFLNLSRESEISESLFNIKEYNKDKYNVLFPLISTEIDKNNFNMDSLDERLQEIKETDLSEYYGIKDKIEEGKTNMNLLYNNLNTILDNYDIVDRHGNHSINLEDTESTYTEWSDSIYILLSNEEFNQEKAIDDITKEFTDKKNSLFQSLKEKLDVAGGFLKKTASLKTKEVHLGPFWRIRSNSNDNLVFEYYDVESNKWVVTFPFIAT